MDDIKAGDMVARFRDGFSRPDDPPCPPKDVPVLVTQVGMDHWCGLSLILLQIAGYPLPAEQWHVGNLYRKLVDDTALAQDKLREPTPA